MKIPDSIRWKSTGKTLGQGGQATVFVVTDKENEFAGEYAFKAVSPGKPKKAYERFAKEIEATKSLDHPHVVRIYDHSAADDSFQFYVMELIDGARPLKKLLNTPDNPFAGQLLKSLKFFRQLASAIAACADAGIVHRDLSPANVLILPNEDVKIIDFGCCQINESERVTLTDEGVGTQNYMAPECESGAAGQVLSQADLYSAGKLLWSAIVNLFAFSREEPAYGAKSMQALFPQQLMAGHFHHLFAGTIRHNYGDRFADAATAIAIAERVEWLISTGKAPLLRFAERATCPSCGWGVLVHMPDAYLVFHNPLPAGYYGCRCNYCGICFPMNRNTLKENVDKMNNLK